MPRLSRAADHGLLWFGLAAGLAATGATGRRAAVRGLVSMGVSSAFVNGPAKLAFRRQRPTLTDVPELRLLQRQPRTTSFPSGHAASAAAFATGVAMQAPALALPVGALAAAVAYSRVHTGVHYPADVAVGAAMGATAAVLLRRTWPVHPDRAAASAPATRAPALTDGAGLVAVVNVDAGSADSDELLARLAEALPRSEVVTATADDDIEQCLADAAARAQVLGVAGGDGTVNCAVGVALRAGLPLAVIPAGTLNHFAADLGLEDVDELADAVRRGTAVEVSVGSAAPDGRDLLFLNTFSLGVYPELVHRRERRERWLGKWAALGVALAEVLRHADPVEVEIDGAPRRLWLLFGGNGRYHPEGFAPSWRERLDEGCIDVRLVDATEPWARTRLVAAVLSGRLGRCRVYEERAVDRLEVRLADRDVQLARDGEIAPAAASIVLRPAAERLVVYRPEKA